MESQTIRLKTAVGRLRAVHRRQVAGLVAIRVQWVALALALAAVCGDALLDLEGGLRLAVDGAWIVVLLGTAVVSYRWYTKAASEERMVARLIESGRPDLGNDLVNALDFEARLEAGPPRDLSEPLMREEIALAAGKAATIADFHALRPPSMANEARVFVAAAGACVVLGLLFPNVVRAVVPRYVDPYGDHPPYCATRLSVAPELARVYYGEDIKITATARGRRPEKVTLALETVDGRPVTALPMFQGKEGEYFQKIEDVKEDLVYLATVPGGRSTRHRLSVIKTPLIESATVVYDYPAYTGRKSETRDLTEPRIVKAYPGTRVTLTLLSNRPLKSGVLTAAGKEYPLAPGGEKAVTGSFPVAEAGELAAFVVDVEGVESREKLSGKIVVLADEKPRISIVSPGMDSFAIPDAKVPIAIEASDDLGVSRVTFFRNLNGSKDSSKEVFTAQGPSSFASPLETFDLADLGVRPGDVIDYYATATDTAPGAPHTVATAAYRLKIVPFEQYREFMQTQTTARDLLEKYNAMLDAVEALAAAQEALNKESEALRAKLGESGAPTAEDAARLKDVEGQQAELARQTEKLGQQLAEQAGQPAVFDVEQQYKQTLKDMAQRLDEAGQAMENSARNLQQAQQPNGTPSDAADPSGQPGSGAGQAMAQATTAQQQALESLGRGKDQFNQGIGEPNRDLQTAYHLMQDAEAFKYLYTRQKGLERQAKSIQDQDAPGVDERLRMTELAQEQATVRESLERLKTDLREHAKPAQERFPKMAEDARAIADEIESRSIEKTMAETSERLARGEGRTGHEGAQQAREQMEAMISFCQAAAGSGQQQCEDRLKLTMTEGAGNTLGQMSKSLSASLGQMGYMGQGANGVSGGSVPYAMFGRDTFGDKSERPGGDIRHMAQNIGKPLPPEGLAANVEELAAPAKTDAALEGAGGEQFVDEYRTLIEAYFRGLAETGQ